MEIQATQVPVIVAVQGTEPVAPSSVMPTANTVAAEKQNGPVDSAEVAGSLNKAVRLNSTALEFTVDDATRSQVVVVRDSDTGDVILQYPTEEALRMIRNLEAGIGGLVDKVV